jgi:hypothetical protein
MSNNPIYKIGQVVYYRNSNPVDPNKLYLAIIKDGLWYRTNDWEEEGYYYSIQLNFYGTKITVHEARLLPKSSIVNELFL